MSKTAENGRGGRTSLREDAELLTRIFGQASAQGPTQGDAAVSEERVVALGRIESAIVRDLTREFLRARRAPIGKERRDTICLWHSITPPITWVSVLRRKDALGTDEANTTGLRLVIPYTKGVVFRNVATDETWRPMDLDGQGPGCDGKLHGEASDTDEVLWPVELPGGIWIMHPDAEQVGMRSERRQGAVEALYQHVRDNGPGEQRSSGLSKIIGGSSPRSVIRDLVNLGILYMVGGTPRSSTDPSRYMIVLLPYRDMDGQLVIPPECERWVELDLSQDTDPPEQAPPVASAPEVKTKEELADEITAMEEAIEARAQAQRWESVAEADEEISALSQRVPALEESILALQRELGEVSEELVTAQAAREKTFSELVPQTTPEMEELERMIALRRQLLEGYDLLFKE